MVIPVFAFQLLPLEKREDEALLEEVGPNRRR